MFAIKLKSINYFVTSHGVGFTADLMDADTKVGTVHNSGTGGPNFLDLIDGWRTKVHYQLEAQAADHDGMEWYLAHLMEVAEKVTNIADYR